MQNTTFAYFDLTDKPSVVVEIGDRAYEYTLDGIELRVTINETVDGQIEVETQVWTMRDHVGKIVVLNRRRPAPAQEADHAD